MGDIDQSPKDRLEYFLSHSRKCVRGKKTKQSIYSWARGPCLSIRTSQGKHSENQDIVEDPRARINMGVNALNYVLYYTFHFIQEHFHRLISSYSWEEINLTSIVTWVWELLVNDVLSIVASLTAFLALTHKTPVTPPLECDTKNAYRYCQVVPSPWGGRGGKIATGW